MTGNLLMSFNPLSLANWIVFLALYFGSIWGLIGKNEVTKKFPVNWLVFLSIYLAITIPMYMLLCLVANYVSPLNNCSRLSFVSLFK